MEPKNEDYTVLYVQLNNYIILTKNLKHLNT